MSRIPIGTITLAGGARLGVCPCPAPEHADALAAWGADAVLTLIEPGPMADAVGAMCRGLGVAWHHLPITDFGAPGAEFEAGWASTGPALHAILERGGRVLVHCLAGRGRSGTIAARLLVEARAMAPAEAIDAVRAVRPGAIETPQQVQHVLSTRPREPGDA